MSAPGPHLRLPPPAVTVRLARPEELDAAGEVTRSAYAAGGLSSADYLDLVADTRDRSRDADVAVAVEHGRRILGCVTFALPGSRWAEVSVPGEAEFRMLGVHPQVQGRGIGRALTRWCIDRARIFGASRILLCTLPEMTGAQRLYRDLGFSRRPECDFSPAPGLLLWCFTLELAPPLGEAPAGRLGQLGQLGRYTRPE